VKSELCPPPTARCRRRKTPTRRKPCATDFDKRSA
jgi:hypothetical protein